GEEPAEEMAALGRPCFERAELAGPVGGAWPGPQRALDPVALTPDNHVGAVELLLDGDLPGEERGHLVGPKDKVVTGAAPGNEVGHPRVRRRAHGSTLPPSCPHQHCGFHRCPGAGVSRVVRKISDVAASLA